MSKPTIRFKGYTDDWEQRKLGNELELLKDGTHGTHQNVDAGVYLLSAKNIKNGRILIDSATDRKISKEEYEGIHKNFSLQKGDVLLTVVGSIGEAAIIENPSGITFQRSVAYLRPKNNLNSSFLYTLAKSESFQNELKKRQVVSAQPGIYLGDLSIIPIRFPENIEEQQKIGQFFKQLDDTIALHQRKLELLKEQKQGFLQKMFPKSGQKVPEIRFEGFTDDWEQRKLGDISEKISVGIATSSSKYFSFEDEGVPFIKNQDIKENRINTKNLEYITKEFDEKNKNKRVKQGDIITARTGYPGLSAVVPKELEGAQTFTTLITRPISEIILSEYISIFINSPYGMKQISGMEAGGAQKNVNASILQNLLIPLPSLDEQNQVSDFVLKLDDTIALHQRKLDKLKQIKQAFLQKMFV